jgi:hypothetical protein
MSAVCATGAGVHSIGFLQCVCEIRTAAPAWGGEEGGSVRAEQVKISSTQAASLRARGGASRAGGSVWGTPPPTLVVAVDHTSTPSQQGGGGIGLPAESADSSSSSHTTPHTQQVTVRQEQGDQFVIS